MSEPKEQRPYSKDPEFDERELSDNSGEGDFASRAPESGEFDLRGAQSMLQRAMEREKAARRRAWLFILVPVLFAVVLIFYTGRQVLKAQQQLADTHDKLASAQSELGQAQRELGNTQATLTPAAQELSQAQIDVANSQDMLATAQVQLTQAADKLQIQSTQIAELQVQIATQQAELNNLQKQSDELIAQLGLASDFQQHVFEGDWELTLKILADTPSGELLVRIADLRYAGAKWGLRGYSLEEGFNSPSFAAYALQDLGMLPQEVNGSITQGELMTILPSKKPDKLRPGDLVYYPGGYCMFYFLDDQGLPFVIGMTPIGILALEPDFAEPFGYYRLYP